MIKILSLTILLLTLTGCCCLLCEPTVYFSPNGRPFPSSWGPPPQPQLKDYVLLPDDYGHGSSTLRNWILLKNHSVQKRLNNLPNSILLETISGPDK